eukprot:CFRG2832T1
MSGVSPPTNENGAEQGSSSSGDRGGRRLSMPAILGMTVMPRRSPTLSRDTSLTPRRSTNRPVSRPMPIIPSSPVSHHEELDEVDLTGVRSPNITNRSQSARRVVSVKVKRSVSTASTLQLNRNSSTKRTAHLSVGGNSTIPTDQSSRRKSCGDALSVSMLNSNDKDGTAILFDPKRFSANPRRIGNRIVPSESNESGDSECPRGTSTLPQDKSLRYSRSQRFVRNVVNFLTDGHVQMVRPGLISIGENGNIEDIPQPNKDEQYADSESTPDIVEEEQANKMNLFKHQTIHHTNSKQSNEGSDTEVNGETESMYIPCYCQDCIEQYGPVTISCHTRHGLDLDLYPQDLTVIDCDCETYWSEMEGYQVNIADVKKEEVPVVEVSIKKKVIVATLCGTLFAAILATFLILYMDMADSGVTIIEIVQGTTVRFSYGWTFTNGLYICMALWVLFKIIRRMFMGFSAIFVQMDESYQRNTITYIMELIWSTMVVIPMVNVFVQAYIFDRGYLGCSNAGDDSKTYCLIGWTYELHFLTLSFCCLYIFELILRASDMRKSLIVHHVATLGYTSYSVILSGTTALSFNVWNTTLGLFHGMFAMFEHPTFMALVCYRMYNKKDHLPWKVATMWLAWVHFGISKLVSHILGLWYYIVYFKHFDTSVQITYPIFAIVIFVAQIYSTWAQYHVYSRLNWEHREYQNQKKVYESETNMVPNVAALNPDPNTYVVRMDSVVKQINNTDSDSNNGKNTSIVASKLDLEHLAVHVSDYSAKDDLNVEDDTKEHVFIDTSSEMIENATDIAADTNARKVGSTLGSNIPSVVDIDVVVKTEVPNTASMFKNAPLLEDEHPKYTADGREESTFSPTSSKGKNESMPGSSLSQSAEALGRSRSSTVHNIAPDGITARRVSYYHEESTKRRPVSMLIGRATPPPPSTPPPPPPTGKLAPITRTGSPLALHHNFQGDQ